MNWIPDDSREPTAGTDAGPAADGPAPDRAGGFPDLSPVALVAGVIGLIAGPLLVDDPTARYVILAADVVAIVFGVLGIWTSFRRYTRLDYAVAGLITGSVSLFLWVRYVSDPPQGGT